MRWFNFLLFRALFSVAMIALLIGGCGGGGETTEDEVSKKVPFTREEVPPGALPDVSAEMGGEGFTGEGWLSNEDYEPSGDPRAKKGGTFSWAFDEFPSTVRPIGKDNNSWVNSIIESYTYEGMIGIHSNTLDITPALATHWKISEDKRTFWFRLNPDARFADGSRLTTADVLASWKLRVDPTILFPSSNVSFGYYEEPVIESPYIIRVTTKELNWRLFLYFAGMSILPAKYIGHLTGTEFLKYYQFEMVPGSGIYELKPEDIVKGRSLTLTRRKDYWNIDNPKEQYTANFDRIKFIVVPEERLRFEKFKKGEIDFYVVGRAQWWIEETDFDNVKRGLVQKRKVFNDEPQGISGLVFNTRREPFNDIRMRQAITYLVNREKLIESLFFNEYMFLDSYYPGGTYENLNNPRYRFDPDKAVALLNECGWTERNNEGYLVKNGQVFELNLNFSQGWDRILTVLQEDFQKVGIKLNLRESTGATLFKMAMERKFGIHWQSWTGLLFPNPETSYASWLADSLNTNNFSGTKNDRIDELLKEYNVTFDQERRVEIIQEIDGILMKIQPYALGWYAPFTRLLYWNKFGQPDYYIGRTSRWYLSIPILWWYDEEKDKVLQAAKQNPSIKLEQGEVEVTYWPEWNAKHGRKFKAAF